MAASLGGWGRARRCQRCALRPGWWRGLYREALGKSPSRFPMPVWLFERLVGTDLTTMWRWLRAHEIALDTGPARALLPEVHTVASWLRARQAAGTAA